MSEHAYPPARVVAPTVQAHFALHEQTARDGGVEAASSNDVDDIEAVIDTAFWASLRRDERYVPRLSIALMPHERATHPLLFESPLPLTSETLVHIAAAVERPGIHLGVWRREGHLGIWGTTRVVPRFSFVLEVSAPGLLVIKHHRDGVGKFVNVAVLEGNQIKIIDERASRVMDSPPLLTALLGFNPKSGHDDPLDVLVQLAVSMRTHGRGGSLLLVPRQSRAWRESIVHPVTYAVQPGFVELAELIRYPPTDDRRVAWQNTFNEAVNALAGLTAVDGATVLSDAYELLAFGAKITRRGGFDPIEQTSVSEPIEGAVPVMMHPTQLGGTRHLSAAQFVHDQRDALALVASQDGRFTVFAWSTHQHLVRAHRVETLLL